MRIAVASSGLDIASSFSLCENFNYYTTKSFEIVASQNIPAQGFSAEDCAELMEHMDVTALICNSIGSTAQSAFESRNIMVVSNKEGRALAAAESLVDELAREMEKPDGEFSDDE